MAWIKVESSVARNRKFVKAGPGPSWLWLCGLAYCQEGLTDGFIPSEAIDYLGVKSARHLTKHLIAAGLWDAVDGGWQIHDYLDHNKPAFEVRRIQRERQDAGANGGKASGEARRKQVASLNEANREAAAKQTANPALTATAEATAEAPTSVGHRQGGAPLHTSHRTHAACGRICVPADLHSQFVRARHHDGADKELRDWYLAVDDEWTIGAKREANPGGNDFAFWRARFAERWPPEPVVKPAFSYAGWRPPTK